jgi:tetratricopeptide (TPR) repeat protein
MPTFGDFETIGEPVSITEQSGHVSTVWRARRAGSDADPTHAVKCFAPHRRGGPAGEAEAALDKDRGLEFLEGIKQLKKAHTEGVRCLAPVYAFGFAAEGAWYVTNFYPRNSLKAWIARRGSVDSAALRQVVHSIATGCLGLKKSRGYSHGNLKAANVFLVGKPRPLRSTPLELADAYPAAPLQLAQLAGEEKHTVDSLLGQVMEAQDLRALGELLLQLVEGRQVSTAYDYNYPIAAAPAWDRLGRDANRWRELCNRLLDPQLSLDKINFETLAQEFRPNALTPHLPKVLAGAGALGLVVIGVYLGLFLQERGRERRQKAEAARLVSLIDESKAALDRNDFAIALAKSEEALRLRSDSKEASAVKTQAREKLEAAYRNELTLAQGALTGGRFDEAEQLASRALQLKQGDPAAGDLMKEAQRQRNARLTQAERDRNYQLALAAAQAALNQTNFIKAMADAERALGYRANDAAATKLKTDAEAGQRNALAQAERDRNYQTAISAAQTALERNDFTNAIARAEVALGYRPNDMTAAQLKANGEAGLKNVLAQAERDRNYQTAISAAQAALGRNDFPNAIARAEAALGYRPNDATAAKLKADAEAGQRNALAQAERDRNYQTAISAGQVALGRNDFTNALARAEVALSYRPNDPTAAKLKADAEAGQRNVLAQAERDRNYQVAISAAQAALARSDFTNAIARAEAALSFRPNDTTAAKLRTDAEAGQRNVLAQAERDRNYQVALSAGQAALGRNDFSNTIARAEAALSFRPNDPTATKLKTDAEAALRNVLLQAERDRNYQVALSAGQAALGQNDFTNAIARAEVALGLRPNDPAATKLKADAEARRQVQEQAARQARYQGSMTAATNALTQAEVAFKGGRHDEAVLKYDEALRQCEEAGRLQVGTDWQALRTLLTKGRGEVQRARDLVLATNHYKAGQYQAALDLCAKHGGPEFAPLQAAVEAERKVFAGVTNDFSQGIYAFLQKPELKEYQPKPLFKEVFQMAAKEQQILAELLALRRATNWSGLLDRWKELGNEAGLRKNSFQSLKSWADEQEAGFAQQIGGYLSELDKNVELWLVRFNLLKSGQAKSPEAQRETAYGEIDDGYKKNILEQLKVIRREYDRLRRLTPERRGNLDRLEKIIPNYP